MPSQPIEGHGVIGKLNTSVAMTHRRESPGPQRPVRLLLTLILPTWSVVSSIFGHRAGDRAAHSPGLLCMMPPSVKIVVAVM